MDFYYYVRVTFREKYRGGEQKNTRLRVAARNSTNAMRRAVRKCVDAGRKDIIKMTVDDINKVPVNKLRWKEYERMREKDPTI